MNAHGMRIWLETDLVKRWLAGKDQFAQGVAMVSTLAKRPGVVGIKIADELGYRDGLNSPDKIRSFLSDSATALRKAAPGKKILVDLLVPELGCAPDHQPPLSSDPAIRAFEERLEAIRAELPPPNPLDEPE